MGAPAGGIGPAGEARAAAGAGPGRMPGARMGMSGLGGLDLGKLGVGAGGAAAASELEDDEFEFGAPRPVRPACACCAI